ncbi:HNH endonuclease [Mesorhizobium sp. STM 4661]|nr:HNH endonuclease [Mesorhizobium sp. STM 4661]
MIGLPTDPVEAQSILHRLLDYDPATGVLTWRTRGRGWFSSDRIWKTWNTRYAGKEAFNRIDDENYQSGAILNKTYRKHQVVWLWVTGKWPRVVDHDDGNRSNNRWENLNEGTQSDNAKNLSLRIDNTSGFIGVSFHKRSSKFQAYIQTEGRRINLGLFATAIEASETQKSKAGELGYNPNHGRAA